MIEQSGDLMSQISKAAEQTIQNYAQGLLTIEALQLQVIQVLQEKQEKEPEKILARHNLLVSLAMQICSNTLYAAWSSKDRNLRELAYENMRRYLERSLHSCPYASRLLHHSGAIDEVLNQTLLELYHNFERNPLASPKIPATFIRWTQMAAIHQAHAFVYKRLNNHDASLDEGREGGEDTLGEQLIDERHPNPEEGVIAHQLQQALIHAILSLPNPSYRKVLLSLYLEGMEEKELANVLGVSAKEIYVWKFRALQALRKNPEIERIRQTWRE